MKIVDGKWDEEFPLTVFQTGSGTQTKHECERSYRSPGKQLDAS